MIKKYSDITRQEWIAYKWIDVTAMGDIERSFIKSEKRTPEEAAKALEAIKALEAEAQA